MADRPRPGEQMPDFDLPTTDGDRLRKADFVGVRPLLLTFGSVTCPMTADADPKPNACYVIDSGGRVAFRALWSNDREDVLAGVLEDVIAGRSPVVERNGRFVPMMRGLARMDETLERSGATARRDVLRQVPPMYAMAKLAGVVRRRSRTAT